MGDENLHRGRATIGQGDRSNDDITVTVDGVRCARRAGAGGGLLVVRIERFGIAGGRVASRACRRVDESNGRDQWGRIGIERPVDERPQLDVNVTVVASASFGSGRREWTRRCAGRCRGCWYDRRRGRAAGCTRRRSSDRLNQGRLQGLN